MLFHCLGRGEPHDSSLPGAKNEAAKDFRGKR
jgi:hypothetical protein